MNTNDLQARMRRYAENQNAREKREAQIRRTKLRIRLGRYIAAAAAACLRRIFDRLPLEAKCFLCAFAGAQSVILLFQLILEMRCVLQLRGL